MAASGQRLMRQEWLPWSPQWPEADERSGQDWLPWSPQWLEADERLEQEWLLWSPQWPEMMRDRDKSGCRGVLSGQRLMRDRDKSGCHGGGGTWHCVFACACTNCTGAMAYIIRARNVRMQLIDTHKKANM